MEWGSDPDYAPGGYIYNPAHSYHAHWAMALDITTTLHQQNLVAKLFASYEPPEKKTPEEALAWMHEKRGKEFL